MRKSIAEEGETEALSVLLQLLALAEVEEAAASADAEEAMQTR